MTPADFASKQDRDPLAEGSRLGPRAIDEAIKIFAEICETPNNNERPERPPQRTVTRQSKQSASQKSESSDRSKRHERPPRPYHRNPEQNQQSRQAEMKFPKEAIVAIVAIAGTVSNGSRPANTNKTSFESRGPERSKRSICPDNHLMNRQYENNAGGKRVHAHQNAFQSPTMCNQLGTSLAARTEWNHQETDGTGRQMVRAPSKVRVPAPYFKNSSKPASEQELSAPGAPNPLVKVNPFECSGIA